MEPQTFVAVARADEIAPGQTRIVEAGGRRIALANVDGTIHAVDNECPHFGGPMGLGKLNGSQLSCPWHGWTFDVKSGENVHAPALTLKCFEVKVEDGQVLVKV